MTLAVAAAMAVQAPRICSSASPISIWPQRTNTVEKRMLVAFTPESVSVSVSMGARRFSVSASNPRDDQANSTTDDSGAPFISQEDWDYLLKLGAGSLVGAAAIKYGSILLPEITRPNIIQALVMISVPVVVAVLLLIKESLVQR